MIATQPDYRITATINDIPFHVVDFVMDEALSTLFSITLKVVQAIHVRPQLSESPLIDHEANITLWDGHTVKRHLTE